jgi:hypothetical protein
MDQQDRNRLIQGRTPIPMIWIGAGIILLAIVCAIAFYTVRGTDTATLPGANSSAATQGSGTTPSAPR